MRVLIDTNVLISAILKPNSIPAKTVFFVSRHDDLYLTNQNIQELMRFVQKKAPQLTQEAAELLEELSYERLPMVYYGSLAIRDKTDQPILNTAIAADIDFVITGDKDFLTLKLEKPKCLRPMEYLIVAYTLPYQKLISDLTKKVINRLKEKRFDASPNEGTSPA